MTIKRKIQSLLKYNEVFSTPIEVLKFRRLYRDTKGNPDSLMSLQLKESRCPLFCRPGTTDPQVLWDTFSRKYHLPPYSLGKDATIVDLGANVGYTMAHFASLYPTSRIFGVEMNYENFLLAKKNLAPLEKQCKIIHAAIWFENGQVSYGGDAEWGYSIVRQEGESKKEVRTVGARTIDSILEENNLKKVDYLKMDIEGAEKFVLQHPHKWISQIESMKIEIHPPATIEECKKILVNHGFSCSQDKISTLPNIIAVRSKS